MVTTDTLEGIIDDSLRFHYDIFTDVLYLRLVNHKDTQTYGDITDEGDLLLRDEATDRAVGLTVVSWWKRFGHGSLPGSIAEIQKQIEPLANKVAAWIETYASFSFAGIYGVRFSAGVKRASTSVMNAPTGSFKARQTRTSFSTLIATAPRSMSLTYDRSIRAR